MIYIKVADSLRGLLGPSPRILLVLYNVHPRLVCLALRIILRKCSTSACLERGYLPSLVVAVRRDQAHLRQHHAGQCDHKSHEVRSYWHVSSTSPSSSLPAASVLTVRITPITVFMPNAPLVYSQCIIRFPCP